MTVKEMQRERLKLYLECERAILSGAQSYTIGSRTLTRADLSMIRKEISDLIESGVTLEETEKLKTGRSKRVVFID